MLASHPYLVPLYRLHARLAAGVVLLGWLASAAHGAENTLDQVSPGHWVEVAGAITSKGALVGKVEEAVREPGDEASKYEISAPVERADAETITVLGLTFTVTADTTFESLQHQPTSRFVPAAGDWVRLKLRRRSDGSPRLRAVRRIEARDRFKVIGEVAAINPRERQLEIGGVHLRFARTVDVELLSATTGPMNTFLADDQKGVPLSIRLGNQLRLGGQVSLGGESQDEFDLNGTRHRDRTEHEIQGKLDALWTFTGGDYVLGELSFGREDTRRQRGVDSHENTLEVTRAFAAFRAGEQTQVVIGRQDFEEEREWLFDEVLDGVRLVRQHGAFETEGGLATGRTVAAKENSLEKTGLAYALSRWQVAPHWKVSGYVLHREDSAADFSLTLFGLRSFQRPKRGFGHWLELSGAHGSELGRSIDGYALEGGLSYGFDAPLRPTIAAGVAHGSGRSQRSGRQGYRQSGLQDNNDKLGGVTSIRYYGELFDPELSNLTIATLAGSVRLLSSLSLSALWHRYQKDEVGGGLVDTGLRVDPNLTHRALGDELDLVLGYRLRRSVTVEVIAARFWADRGYTATADATLLEVSTRFSF